MPWANPSWVRLSVTRITTIKSHRRTMPRVPARRGPMAAVLEGAMSVAIPAEGEVDLGHQFSLAIGLVEEGDTGIELALAGDGVLGVAGGEQRSEEHTSELQSRENLV